MRVFSCVLAVCCFLFLLAPPASGATIDVMIVYDSTAKSWVESHGGKNTFAADAVARMNDAIANSSIALTFRLVHVAEVAYTCSGDLSADLNNLQTGSGSLAVVHQWRDNYGADLVAMMVDTGSSGNVAGIAQMLTSLSGQPDHAFSVSDIQSVDISHTLTHEVGHNLGCSHSKYQLDNPGPNTALNAYSAGWYFTGTNAVPYHTIMAYDSDGYGNIYTEAPLFSTPLLNYQGTVAGDAADGDNARNIRETMDVVAAYRPDVDTVPDPFTFADQINAALGMDFVSNAITISGINGPSPVSITGGTYSINGGAFTSTDGTVSNGDAATVKLTSSASYAATTNATLTIGGISDTFSVTTQPDPLGGAWTQKASFGGTARKWAASFSIGSKGYIVTGWDGADKNELWEYDPAGGTWMQKMDFPGTPRDAAIAFSIGSKGYVGTGGDNSSLALYRDFWEYDPEANLWKEKAPFGGTERWGAVGFSIGGKGYIGTGDDGGATFRKDFWEYDPDTDVWTQKAPFGGTARAWAVGFAIGGKGYIGTGYNGSLDTKDFWEYDPVVNVWRRKADFGGTAREFPVGFSIGNKGYIGTGFDGLCRNDFWEYDPIVNTWIQRTVFGGVARDSAVGFSIGSKGYVGTGGDDSLSALYRDFWEYSPYRMKGDLNDDRKVTLADAVMAMQVVSGMKQPGAITVVADVDGDMKIGVTEVIYVLQKVAGLR